MTSPAGNNAQITKEQREFVLGAWSGPAYDPALARDELLHELFEASADLGPERPAVIRGDITLTYRELDERANRLARCLRGRGAANEARVAVFLPRSEQAYAAILGVLKAGCAYVPLDPETPAERVAFILEDCRAKCLVTTSALASVLDHVLPAGVSVLELDSDEQEIAGMPAARLTRAETGARRENLCYLIYTSGTTGRPKGVQIEHRNATNLVRAESALYGVNRDDRIFQFASTAFDASVEEIWLAFFHGAALVTGTKEIMRSGRDFSAVLAKLGVTVFSCVPTFLLMLEEDIPTLRVLILGGETCPPDVQERWCRAGRTVFNTYGPTEATVIATATVMQPGRPVTIGRPIANYKVYLLDELLEPVPPGAEGEICIGGEGVARGYLNRPELQEEKFVTAGALGGPPVRLYRTGDLGRFTPEGEIEYLGRADGQVKLRGYRVELSEIEAVLMQCPGVLAAAAALHAGTQQLAAYIVPRAGQKPDRALIKETLSAKLPPYMVPAFLDEIAELPLLPSNKIDRRGLPAPRDPLRAAGGTGAAARSGEERTVLGVWEDVLGLSGISIHDDFFLDLGGHSLLAALAASKLRRLPGFERLSVADIYTNPTAAKLAALAGRPAAAEEPARPPFRTASRASYFACMAGQALGIIFLAGLYAWQWLGAFLAYGYLVVADWPMGQALAGALLVYLVTTPAVLALSIAVKWLLLGRIRAGNYPLWGWYYWRYWFARAVMRVAPLDYLDGTPFLNVYYRLMGAKIGRDVFLGEHGLTSFDIFSIGDNSSIGPDSTVDGVTVEDGLLKIAPVTIGRGCFIGNRCSVGSGAVVEDGAGLGALSMLPDGARIPPGESWSGSPALPAGKLQPETPRAPWSAGSYFAHGAGALLFPLVTLAAIFPGLMVITHLGHISEGYLFLVAAPAVALSFVVLLCAEVWAVKWLLLGRIRAGRYPVGGSFYVRKWFFDQLMDLSLEVIGTFYTTLYLPPWLKALGAKLGPRSEISTIRFIHPDLLEAGAECFMADDVSVGAPTVRGGWAAIGVTKVGSRVFLGNSAFIPAGSVLGSNTLIGVLSIPPVSPSPVPDGSSWLGSPAINLPARQKAQGFTEAQTYDPPRRLVALRLFIEFFRVILPSTIFVVLASAIITATDILQDYIELQDWLLALPFMYIAAGILAVGAALALKKLLIGRYRAGEKPLWCVFVWCSELATGVYENLAVLFFLDLLRGTPFLPVVLRLFGVRIGKRCYIDTTWFTEFDLIEIGDEVSFNENANIQTHLFEDRVMKMGEVRIGNRCAVGTMSTVLYDTEMGEGSALGDLSLLMKGEKLPPGTRWRGIPSRR